MRKLIPVGLAALVLVVCLLAYFGLRQSANADYQYESVNLQNVSSLVADAPRGSLLAAVRAELPHYRSFMGENFEKSGEQMIDVILMAHMQLDDSLTPLVVSSQKQVEWILEQANPDIVAREGSFSDRLSERQILKDQDMLGTDLGMESGNQLPVGHQFTGMHSDGVVWYMRSHPDVHALGAEDRTLVVASMAVGMLRMQTSDERIALLDDNLSRLRSEMALARLIAALRKTGKTRGAIVIGGGHHRDFELLQEQLEIPITIYCAAGEYDDELTGITLEDVKKCAPSR